MIMGEVCTRLSYCAVSHGRPVTRPEESTNVARRSRRWASACGDHRSIVRPAHGGASASPPRSRRTRAELPPEVLIRTSGAGAALHTVLDAGHLESQHRDRPRSTGWRAWAVATAHARTAGSFPQAIPAHSTNRRMVDLARSMANCSTPSATRAVGCDSHDGRATPPAAEHAPMVRYYHPDEFANSRARHGPSTSNRGRGHKRTRPPTRMTGGRRPVVDRRPCGVPLPTLIIRDNRRRVRNAAPGLVWAGDWRWDASAGNAFRLPVYREPPKSRPFAASKAVSATAT
jgi:hypothetical protein